MLELLANAWQGWQQYVSNGKYMALLLAVLLFLWFRREQAKEKVLLLYATVTTVMCIIPVSAAFLMAYQTRYYDYQWIWNYVPVTLMIAYGGTIFLTEYWEHYRKSIWKCAGITIAVLGVLFLCGSMGQEEQDSSEMTWQSGEVQMLLGVLSEDAREQHICLWAPKNVMEAARAYDGSIQLLYGRNMWDAALGGYSYETYSETQESLYLWMCHVEETGELDFAGEAEEWDGVRCVETAKAAGVNRILLPGSIAAEELSQLAAAVTNLETIKLGEYYLLALE